MRLSFHGADHEVTGSCHMIEANGKRILVDCGLFQGRREIEAENLEHFGFDPASVDLVLLTHAHLDHCGRLPLLAMRGFKGEIISTSATRDLARVVMLDSAHIQEEDSRHQRRRARRRGDEERPPLYTTLDALDAIGLFGRIASYGEAIELAPGLTATFYDAGHILGSASIRVESSSAGLSGTETRSVIFSGDLGNSDRPILRDPQLPPRADAVVMETTYGDRMHKSLPPSVEELYDAVNDTLARGGNVIIPTFALERAQEILFHLKRGIEEGRLPRNLPVYLDSPMAISATQIFRKHPECFDEETAAMFDGDDDPFDLPRLHFTRETAASIALNQHQHGSVIMAGSGMCTGGRVRHHLRHNLSREDSSVIFVGYAAEGTLARLLIEGAEHIRLYGEQIPVKARLYTINGFSAHADRSELLAWHQALAPAQTILVHGEESAMRSFAKALHDTTVHMPEKGDELRL